MGPSTGSLPSAGNSWLSTTRGWVDVHADPLTVHAARRELDGLAAVLENHFGYEERMLVPILDALRPAPGSPDRDLVNRALTLSDGQRPSGHRP